MKAEFERLWWHLLLTPQGIDGESYGSLVSLGEKILSSDELWYMRRQVKSVPGVGPARFYIPILKKETRQ